MVLVNGQIHAIGGLRDEEFVNAEALDVFHLVGVRERLGNTIHVAAEIGNERYEFVV